MKQIPLLLFWGWMLACTQIDPQIERILRLSDRRVKCDSLQTYLKNPGKIYRTLAVQAVGKLQQAGCLNALIESLNDPDPNVRLETAFALGQIGQASAENAVIEGLHSKEIIEVKVRIVEALGKIGAERSIPVLVHFMKNDNNALRTEAALAVGRMALRNITNPVLTQALTLLLNDKTPDVRWKACYSMMRIGKELDLYPLRRATQDSDPRVRMYAAQALGNLQDPVVLESLGNLVGNDPDWRVRVKAANALGKYPLRRVANFINLTKQAPHVRIALIQAIGSSALLEPEGYLPNSREHNIARNQLELLLNKKTDLEVDQNSGWSPTPAEIGHALISYAQLLKEKAADKIIEFADYGHPRVRARAMQALAETGTSNAVRIFEDHYSDAPGVVRIAILEALGKMNEYPEPRIFIQALQEKDQVLVALAAQGLSQDTLRNKIYAQPIVAAYQGLAKPVDAEVAQMIFNAMVQVGDTLAVPALLGEINTPDQALSKAAANALNKLTGKDFASQVSSSTRPHFDFAYADVYALKGARALVKTNQGDIEILMYTQEAPLTVLNFARLAEKGFFNRLTFHRVVPNFVIQGGDPRGDSWGSPGYAIRSEFNKRPFIRGSVGMASAGKDTEGCQFFITHAEQPHLDGKYTVFGQVISGMDVVDAIQEGDVMELVTIRR